MAYERIHRYHCDFCSRIEETLSLVFLPTGWIEHKHHHACENCYRQSQELSLAITCPTCGRLVGDVYVSSESKAAICTPCMCRFNADGSEHFERILAIRRNLVLKDYVPIVFTVIELSANEKREDA